VTRTSSAHSADPITVRAAPRANSAARSRRTRWMPFVGRSSDTLGAPSSDG